MNATTTRAEMLLMKPRLWKVGMPVAEILDAGELEVVSARFQSNVGIESEDGVEEDGFTEGEVEFDYGESVVMSEADVDSQEGSELGERVKPADVR